MFHFKIISCKDLPRKDANGLIDSYVVIETKGKENKARPGGKTKVVQNDLNPVYPDQTFDIPSDNCYTVKFTVMDEDVLKDDMACWIKIKVPSLMTRLGDKITKEMLVKNPEHHPNCRPAITFMVTLDGDLASDHPAKDAQVAIPPKPKYEPLVIEPVKDHNIYVYNILVLDPENKKYYFSENPTVPSFIKKEGDKYTIDHNGRKLIVIPVFRTTRDFKKTVLKVKTNDLTLEQTLIYRGEWLMDKALNLPSKEIKQIHPFQRNQYNTQNWVSLLPEQIKPAGEYTAY